MKKKRVLLLSVDSLLGESIEQMLSQLEDVELVGPWQLDAGVLPRLAEEMPDMVLVVQGDEGSAEMPSLASQILERYPNLSVVRIGLQENVIRVTATRTLPARSADLIELIRNLLHPPAVGGRAAVLGKDWKLALPLHPEFRTLPMLFYVPPMLPVMASAQDGGSFRLAGDFFSSLESARVPVRYMASLFAAGNEEKVVASYKKLIAVRFYKRVEAVGDITAEELQAALAGAGMSVEEAEAIYRLTALPTFEERFVIPPMAREMAIEETEDPFAHKIAAGFGFRKAPQRGW